MCRWMKLLANKVHIQGITVLATVFNYMYLTQTAQNKRLVTSIKKKMKAGNTKHRILPGKVHKQEPQLI